ncbi:helix-turn-helix domain-containing protein [Lactobacillus sp. CC-MHH1034]|uniref:helix-turn-helix domain-containing protein n=1 Tax=Agrilactobacillus fermenti TaxID=2586909 RepID=UPI001E418DA8|nr:helix-turn-helix domain-containing protein [Agrilactobacillus fermenti]
MKNGRKTTQLERIEIAEWVIELECIEIAEWVIANDMDYTGATKQYDISYGQVYAWVKKFKQGGPEALVDRRGKAKALRSCLAIRIDAVMW